MLVAHGSHCTWCGLLLWMALSHCVIASCTCIVALWIYSHHLIAKNQDPSSCITENCLLLHFGPQCVLCAAAHCGLSLFFWHMLLRVGSRHSREASISLGCGRQPIPSLLRLPWQHRMLYLCSADASVNNSTSLPIPEMGGLGSKTVIMESSPSPLPRGLIWGRTPPCHLFWMSGMLCGNTASKQYGWMAM